MHPENFESNGLVMYLPKRVEFLTSPAIDSYSMPWYKQLVAHEYRHAVQYNNLNRGVIRVLSYILGQQGSTIGLLCMPVWAMEGDAVMSETMMSSFAADCSPPSRWPTGPWAASGATTATSTAGSAAPTATTSPTITNWVIRSAPTPGSVTARMSGTAWRGLGRATPTCWPRRASRWEKYYDTNVSRLFRETFDELERFWSSLPEEPDTARPLVELPERNHTEYQWPLALGDTAVLAVKTDLDRVSRFVTVDLRTGREREVAATGLISTRPTLGNGRVWWTEYRRSALFEQRVNSQLCYMNLADGRTRTVGPARRALYPTSTPDALGWVEYAPEGRYTVVVRRNGGGGGALRGARPHGVARTGVGRPDAAWYVLVTDGSGMWIGRIDAGGLHAVTRGAYITLSDLRASDGRLYYGSIASGKDEAHCYDLTERCEYRLTTSTYGSFDPAPAGDRLLVTTYDRRGYRLASQPADSVRIPVEARRVPLNPGQSAAPPLGGAESRYGALRDGDSTLQSSDFGQNATPKCPIWSTFTAGCRWLSIPSRWSRSSRST